MAPAPGLRAPKQLREAAITWQSQSRVEPVGRRVDVVARPGLARTRHRPQPPGHTHAIGADRLKAEPTEEKLIFKRGEKERVRDVKAPPIFSKPSLSH